MDAAKVSHQVGMGTDAVQRPGHLLAAEVCEVEFGRASIDVELAAPESSLLEHLWLCYMGASACCACFLAGF